MQNSMGWSLCGVERAGFTTSGPRVRNPELNYHGSLNFTEDKYRRIFEGEVPHPRTENYAEHLSVLERFRGAGRLLDMAPMAVSSCARRGTLNGP